MKMKDLCTLAAGSSAVFVLSMSSYAGGSNCCISNGGLGCDNAACEATVCAVDSFCCSVAWDGICAAEAASLCAVCGGGGSCTGDFDGNGVVDAADLAVLLGAWETPAGDLNGDGNTNGADLAILLGAWGPCP